MKDFSIALKNHLYVQHQTNTSLAKDLCDLLGLSKDSVYRRLRGEASFTLDEAVCISKEYKISLDLLMSSHFNTFGTYRFRPLYDEEPQLSKNVKAVTKLFTYLAKQQGKMHYIAEAAPLFRLLATEKLRDFSVYYWKKVILNYPSHTTIKFDDDYFIPKEYLLIVEQLTQQYLGIHLTEIWTKESLKKVLFQIEYAVESGFIVSEAIVKQLYVELETLIDSVDDSATSGQNMFGGSYTLFECEIQLENNCVYTEANNVTNCFLNFNNFNNISIGDEIFSQEVASWIDNLKTRSIQLSGQAEKRRNQFIDHQKQLLDASCMNSLQYVNRRARQV